MVLIKPFTMLARPGDEADITVWERESVADLVHPHPEVLNQSVVRIVRPKRDVVFRHTGNHTGTTARTLVQINNHPIPVSFSAMMYLAHSYPLCDVKHL
jgi:predicted P-loop ATPase/GTPase